MKKTAQPFAYDLLNVLLKTESQADQSLLKWLAQLPLTIRKEPTHGLVMMTISDCHGQDFHLGEVLVTEAEVVLDNKIGYAQVIGNQPYKALARACAAAILEAGDVKLQNRLKRFLLRQDKKFRKKEEKEEQLLASTKVNFEVMAQW